MSPRLATFVMFLVNGVVIGTWIAAIPSVKDGLGATGGDFGMALLFGPIGALVAQQVTGQLLVRVSSQRLLIVAALIFPWLVEIPAIFFLGLWFFEQLLAGSLSLGRAEVTGGVAWWAHAGGFVCGVVLSLRYRRPRAPRRRREIWIE
mgnify:CR=1 FL=1